MRAAYCMRAKEDPLPFLLMLNHAVAAQISSRTIAFGGGSDAIPQRILATPNCVPLSGSLKCTCMTNEDTPLDPRTAAATADAGPGSTDLSGQVLGEDYRLLR
jgi:hypothetical protein